MENPKYIYISDNDNEVKNKPITTKSNKPNSVNSSDLLMYGVLLGLLICFTGWLGVTIAGIFIGTKVKKIEKEQADWQYKNEPFEYEYSERKERDEMMYTKEQQKYLKKHPWLFINEKGEYQGKWKYCKKAIKDYKRGAGYSLRYRVDKYKEGHRDDPLFQKTAEIGYRDSIRIREKAFENRKRSLSGNQSFMKFKDEDFHYFRYVSYYTDDPNEYSKPILEEYDFTKYKDMPIDEEYWENLL